MPDRNTTPLPFPVGNFDLLGSIQAGAQLRQLLQPPQPNLGGGYTGPGKQKREKAAAKDRKEAAKVREDEQAHDIEVEKLRQEGRTKEQETSARLDQEKTEFALSIADKIAKAEADALFAKDVAGKKAAVRGEIEALMEAGADPQTAQQLVLEKYKAHIQGDKLKVEQAEANIAMIRSQAELAQAQTRGVDADIDRKKSDQDFDQRMKRRQMNLNEKLGEKAIDLQEAQIKKLNAEVQAAETKALMTLTGTDPKIAKEHMSALSQRFYHQKAVVESKAAKLNAITERLKTVDPADQAGVEGLLKTASTEYENAVKELETQAEDYQHELQRRFGGIGAEDAIGAAKKVTGQGTEEEEEQEE